jgi:hypothetical protein
VAAGFRKLHNEELYNVYFSPNIIRMPRQGGKRIGVWCENQKERDN